MAQRIAYVTGGMGGIGTAICQRLAKDGYTVVAGCGPSRDFGKWLDEQKALGYTFHASVGNVGDWDSTVAAFEKVKAEVGPVDVLVNNAGITRDGMFRKMSQGRLARGHRDEPELAVQRHEAGDRRHGRARLRTHHQHHRRSTARRASSARPTIRRPRPASTASRWRSRRRSRAKGVTVNTVSPGYIGTEMVRAIRQDVLDKIVAGIPVKRLGLPEEIGSIVSWIASRRGRLRDRRGLLAERRPAHGLTRQRRGGSRKRSRLRRVAALTASARDPAIRTTQRASRKWSSSATASGPAK